MEIICADFPILDDRSLDFVQGIAPAALIALRVVQAAPWTPPSRAVLVLSKRRFSQSTLRPFFHTTAAICSCYVGVLDAPLKPPRIRVYDAAARAITALIRSLGWLPRLSKPEKSS